MTKFISKIILAVFLIAFINGCSNNTIKTNSNTEHAHSEKKTQDYVSTLLGIHNDTVYDSKNNWFKVQENSVFAPEIEIGNDYPHKNKYSVLFFMDYKQIPVEYNKQQKESIDVDMKKNSERNLKVKINNLEKGKHNFMVLLIRKPYEYITKDEYVPGLEVYISQRRTLIVGENVEKDTLFKRVEAQEQSINADLFITENMKGELEQQLNVLKKSEAANYWLHIPSEKDNTKLILIAIAGNKQLNIENPYVEIRKRGVVNMPLKEIQGMNNLSTPNNLTVIAINDDPSQINQQPISTNKITMVK